MNEAWISLTSVLLFPSQRSHSPFSCREGLEETIGRQAPSGRAEKPP